MPPPPKGTPPPQGDTPTQVGPWVDIGDGGGSPIQTTPLLFSHCFIPGTAHPPTPKMGLTLLGSRSSAPHRW